MASTLTSRELAWHRTVLESCAILRWSRPPQQLSSCFQMTSRAGRSRRRWCRCGAADRSFKSCSLRRRHSISPQHSSRTGVPRYRWSCPSRHLDGPSWTPFAGARKTLRGRARPFHIGLRQCRSCLPSAADAHATRHAQDATKIHVDPHFVKVVGQSSPKAVVGHHVRAERH